MKFLVALRKVRDSFWFIPGLLLVSSLVLAEVLVAVDKAADNVIAWNQMFFFHIGVEGSRGILSSIASTTLAVASMAFSITLSIMASASSSYGPRLVKNFVTDRENQVVLGTFTSTFLYSLIVLRYVKSETDDGESFVPQIAVNIAMVLAVLSVCMLIYFIHHISHSIQPTTISKRLKKQFSFLVEKYYDDPQDADSDATSPQFTKSAIALTGVDSMRVKADEYGYITSIDYREITKKLHELNVKARVEVMPGSHIIAGETLAVVYGAVSADEVENLKKCIRGNVFLDEERTDYRDIEFVLQCLLELAVRAISPSTNDPYTAMNILDEIGVGLVKACSQPGRMRGVQVGGTPVLVFKSLSQAELVEMVFDQIRPYILGNPLTIKSLIKLSERIVCLGSDVEAIERAQSYIKQLMQDYLASDASSLDQKNVLAYFEQKFPGVALESNGVYPSVANGAGV